MPRNAVQQTDKRILTPTKALSQVSPGLTPAVPQSPARQEPRGEANSIHCHAGSPPVPQPGWPVRVAQRDSPGGGDTGEPRQGNYWKLSSQVCWSWDLPRHDEPNPETPSARAKPGCGVGSLRRSLRRSPRALTGPQSDTVHCRSHGGPVQFFSARGRALASQSFSSSEQRMSLVTTLRSPQRAEHCREGTKGTRRHRHRRCPRGWVFFSPRVLA